MAIAWSELDAGFRIDRTNRRRKDYEEPIPIVEHMAGKGAVGTLPPPNSEPQRMFVSSAADIVVYGGAAGGGKTYGLLLDMANPEFIKNPGYGFVVFRRQSPQITNEGGLWDASQIYRDIGAWSRVGDHSWHFLSGASGRFAHLVREDDKYAWQGTELPRIGFDELPHFTEGQFFYLLSRNRSTCGIRPQVRATCNPDPGWVKRFLAPWVDKTYPNPAKSGELRWFTRVDGKIVWVDEEWRDKDGHPPKSVTFIRSSLYDNVTLMEKDPSYEINLKSQSAVERARLLDGDWDVFEGSFFAEWGTDPGHQIIPPYVPGQLPGHWQIFGGLDANGIAKQAFGLCATDELGGLHVIESFKDEGQTPSTFCAQVLACLSRWGVPRNKCPMAADPAMFHDNSRRDQVGEADIEVYWRAGLNCFEANNNRKHGWSRFREWLQRPNAFHVWRGYNSDLVDLFPSMLHDPLKPGDMLKKDVNDDLFDALRYAMMTRPSTAKKPDEPAAMLTPGMHPPMAPVIPMRPENLPDQFRRDEPQHDGEEGGW